MAKIDRLGWAAGLSFISYGVRIGIRVNQPQALSQILERLPPAWKISSSPVVERLYSLFIGGTGARPGVRRFHLLYGDSQRLARATDLDAVWEIFESDLQLAVAEAARRRVFVHAGVVGWRGRAIIIPGQSFSGKTTLVAELVRAGATYYSDEYAVLDERGRAHPYARPLAMRDEDSYRQRKVPAQALGGTTGSKPLPVGLIVVSQYKAGARWRPRLLSAGQGALELLAHTVSARRAPQRALAALQRAVASAPVFKSARGEARETAAAILAALR